MHICAYTYIAYICMCALFLVYSWVPELTLSCSNPGYLDILLRWVLIVDLHCPRLWLLSIWTFLKNTLFFRAVLGLQQNWEESAEISHMPPVSTHVQPPQLSMSLIRKYIFLPRVNLHWHIIITQSSWFTLELTPDVCTSHRFGLKYDIYSSS